MSDGGVYGSDMEDESAYEHPTLADLLGDARVAYGVRPPRVGPALAEFFHAAPTPLRRKPMRRALAQLAAATTAVVAATGGLAIAGALPGSVQELVSGNDAGDGVPLELTDGSTTTSFDVETTTTVADGAPTTVPADPSDREHPDNHGAEVSEVARDRSLHGCEHGRAVSEVASGKVNDKPCPGTGETPPGSTTTTTVAAEGGPSSEAGDDAPGRSGSAPGRNRR